MKTSIHCFIVSCSLLLRMKNVLDESCRQNRNTRFMFNNNNNFYVSLTVHLSMTLANDQFDTHFFKYIYYDSLHEHVSSNILLILRSSNCINTASDIVTVSK
jgi:hypothetical protein